MSDYSDLEPVVDARDPLPDEQVARSLLSRAAEHLGDRRPDLAANACRLACIILEELEVEPVIDAATGDMYDVVLVHRPKVEAPVAEWGEGIEDAIETAIADLRRVLS